MMDIHPGESIIALADVHKKYGHHAVLRGVELEVPKGEFLCLMGESGSGKSTLLNLIAGIDRPERGRIWISGRDITGLEDDALTHLRRNRIGFIFQFFNLLPNLNVMENVAIPQMLRDGQSPDVQWIRELLEKVGAGDKAESRIQELSGGEQQRVAIARALAGRPEIIIADEPTGSLDRRSGDQILSLIRDQVHGDERTVIMVTHSERVAAAADRVLNIRDGQVENA